MNPPQPLGPSNVFTTEALHDLALLALVIAHGADSDLDPREIDTIAERLFQIGDGLSGDDVIVVFRDAARAYMDMQVIGAEVIVENLGQQLDEDGRKQAFALLRAVAEADGIMHLMESTLLRHVAQAWDIGPAFVRPSPSALD